MLQDGAGAAPAEATMSSGCQVQQIASSNAPRRGRTTRRIPLKLVRVVTLIALSAAVTSAGFAQQVAKDTTPRHASPKSSAAKAATPKTQPKAKENLQVLAKISLDSATKVALSRVPGGTVKKHELEREDGHFIYSFDIAARGKTGIEEVWVSAIDGHVVKQEHETPAMEKVEAAKEKIEAKAPKKKP